MWVRCALSLVGGPRVFIAVCDRCSADSARWGADTTMWARVALRSRGSVLVSLLCDTVEMGVSFLGPAQRCRARGHVHRDMVHIIRCMRDGSSTEISH